MICSVVIYFVVVFTDGRKEARLRWTDRKYSKVFVNQLLKPEELKKYDSNLATVEDIKVQVVDPFDCNKGPFNEQAPPQR